jgi:hypothetical protein
VAEREDLGILGTGPVGVGLAELFSRQGRAVRVGTREPWHRRVTSDAIARGIDVRGLFHWTAVDNYEWLNGYDLQFGIIDRDRNVRPSARALQREATATGNGAIG